jgi:hypothetical protein
MGFKVTTVNKPKRFPLKPLYRRQLSTIDRYDLFRAMRCLDDLACGEEMLETIKVYVRNKKGENEQSRLYKEDGGTEKHIGLVKALFAARRIPKHKYVFYCSSATEYAHDDDWMTGRGGELLGKIRNRMKLIEEEYGLKPDEYWPTGQAPKEYDELSRQSDEIYDEMFAKKLRSFGLNDLAELWNINRREFDELRERGRRSVYHKDELICAIKDSVVRFEEEARLAAQVKAYLGAITLLGSGLEGLLVVRCLQAKHKSKRFAKTLSRKNRPSPLDDPTKWTFDALIETCLAAGWLPPISTTVAVYSPAGLAHMLRGMRNYVHPGRQGRENPWAIVDEDDYKVAEAIFITLKATIFKRNEREHHNQQA